MAYSQRKIDKIALIACMVRAVSGVTWRCILQDLCERYQLSCEEEECLLERLGLVEEVVC